MYRILLGDDHAVVRKGIYHILDIHHDIDIAGEASSLESLAELVTQHPCDAVIMDIKMPGCSGIEWIKRLRAIRPDLQILVLSAHPEDQFAVRVIRAGAAGYIAKTASPEELVRAIRKVCAGGRYVSEALAEQLAKAMGADLDQAPHQLLSDREFQVLRMMAQGMTPTQIAETLQISIKTVTTYRARILGKMRLKNSAQLIRYALIEGLVE